MDLKNSGLKPEDIKPGADLGGANLRGADLGGANLRGANLSGADLRGAILPTTLADAGCDPRGYRFVGMQTDAGFRILAGCRFFSLEEAKAHWVDNPDVLARVTLLETLAVLRGL